MEKIMVMAVHLDDGQKVRFRKTAKSYVITVPISSKQFVLEATSELPQYPTPRSHDVLDAYLKPALLSIHAGLEQRLLTKPVENYGGWGRE